MAPNEQGPTRLPSLSPLYTNRLPNPNQQHTLGHHTIRIVQMQHADTRLQAIEAEACPRSQVVAETFVVHDFESGIWS
jgi:hypothetical protein